MSKASPSPGRRNVPKLDFNAPFFTKLNQVAQNKDSYELDHFICGICEFTQFEIVKTEDETGVGILCQYRKKVSPPEGQAEATVKDRFHTHHGALEVSWRAADECWDGKTYIEQYGVKNLCQLQNTFHVRLQDCNVSGNGEQFTLELATYDLPQGHEANPWRRVCVKKVK